jgi:parallel beta-helix repeat protein
VKKSTLLLVLLLILCFVVVSIPEINVAKAEYSDLTPPEKVLTILEEVVCLDMAKYSTDLEFYAQFPLLYFDVLPQEDVKYVLKSNESELEVICAFVDEKLRSMRIYVKEGSPLTTQPATTPIEMAKDFLDKYPTNSDTSDYDTMLSMLKTVEADKNTTITVENIILEVTTTGSHTSFRWKYSFNGIEAPSKCLALKFENGFLDYFVDTWSLCTIGSTDLSISEEEAIEIAMNAAENHSWNLSSGTTVTGFNIVGVSETTLSFGNYPTKNESRGGNPLTLYPGWRVKLYFDKLYPGSVYGLDIAIWADTGEVNDIRELLTGLGDFPNNEIPEFPSWIILPLLIVATLIVTIVRNKLLKKGVRMRRPVIKLISNVFLFLIAGFLCMNIVFSSYWPDPGPDIPRIYIRNNGDVQPGTSLIEKTDNIYKLTGNIVNHTIDIQCDNIVLDGEGYSIQGNASRIKGYDDGNNGILIDGQKNVMIKNINFEQGETGIRITNSSNITIIANSFSDGIYTGITLQGSTEILIENNNLIDLHTDIGCPAAMLNGSKITFRNNTLTGSSYGVKIIGSSNLVSENTFECMLPIQMDNANSNIISMNKISGPANWSDREPFTGNEGISLFRSCSNNIIFGNNMTGFVNQAIRTVFSCSNNTFYGNYIADTGVAVSLQDGAIDNTFFGNTFTFGSCKFRIADNVEGTAWDNGSIGNYWGDYAGTDNNEDGIGDSPYVVTGVKWDNDVGGDVSFVAGQDNYPLMNPVDIAGIPEFPSWVILPLLMVATLFSIIIRKKIRVL